MSDSSFCRYRGTGRCNKKSLRTPEISSNSFSDSNDLLFCVHQYYKMHRVQVLEGYKAQWLLDHELSFAYLLADHKSQRTLNKASIVKTILPEICKRLNEDFGLSLTVAQLTTKYYSLRHLARLYNNLVRNETGMGWDPVLECPTADDERWEKLIQTDKNYGKFKNQCCTQYKVLNEVFEDTVATGRYGQSSGTPFTQPDCDTEELNNFNFSQFGRVVGEGGKNRAVEDDVQILERGKGKKRDYDSSGKQSEGGYISTDYRKRVSVEEAMAMVLVCTSHDNRQRELAERFQRSTETIHRNLTEGIMALVRLAPVVIKARNQHLVHPKILNNTKYFSWFKDCIGAIDGTLVPAYAPAAQHDAFRCRKGYLAQNVMCACDHDMRFVYVYAGMEGSAHDAACFQQAVLAPNSDFRVPPMGKYYAVDAAYRNIPGFLGPIKGKRYQISDFRGRRNGPKGKEELFNMRHSSIRNVIERAFGVLKKRFPFLEGPMQNYMMQRQTSMVIACCVLHNFIREQLSFDDLFHDEDVIGSTIDLEDDGFCQAGVPPVDLSPIAMNNWKEFKKALVDHMWAYRRR